MTTDDAIRVLTQEEAVERLLARGWTRVRCVTCEGQGRFTTVGKDAADWMKTTCQYCGGDGTTWVRPT